MNVRLFLKINFFPRLWHPFRDVTRMPRGLCPYQVPGYARRLSWAWWSQCSGSKRNKASCFFLQFDKKAIRSSEGFRMRPWTDLCRMYRTLSPRSTNGCRNTLVQPKCYLESKMRNTKFYWNWSCDLVRVNESEQLSRLVTSVLWVECERQGANILMFYAEPPCPVHTDWTPTWTNFNLTQSLCLCVRLA